MDGYWESQIPGCRFHFCPRGIGESWKGPSLELEEGEGQQSCWVELERSRPGLKESMGTQEHAGSEAAPL